MAKKRLALVSIMSTLLLAFTALADDLTPPSTMPTGASTVSCNAPRESLTPEQKIAYDKICAKPLTPSPSCSNVKVDCKGHPEHPCCQKPKK
jgi:hypothetical protein